MTHAYFLIAHGSPSAYPQQAMAQLVQYLAPLGPVGWGALECQDLPLEQQIGHFCQQVQQPVVLLPLFLFPGYHAVTDVPAAIATAQAHLSVPLKCLPFLGSQPRFQAWLREELRKVDAAILVGHGSRRPEVTPWFQQLCNALGVLPALLQDAKSLDHALAQRQALGHQHSHCFGYFLFGGKTVEAFIAQVEQLQTTYPQQQLSVSPAIAPSAAFAALLADILIEEGGK